MNKDNKKTLSVSIGTIIGWFISIFLDGLMLMIAWNAIGAACGLPTFSYWVYVAVFWVVRSLCNSLASWLRKK